MSADVRYVRGYEGWEVLDRATGRFLGHVMHFPPEWYAWAVGPRDIFVGTARTRREATGLILAASAPLGLAARPPA